MCRCLELVSCKGGGINGMILVTCKGGGTMECTPNECGHVHTYTHNGTHTLTAPLMANRGLIPGAQCRSMTETCCVAVYKKKG